MMDLIIGWNRIILFLLLPVVSVAQWSQPGDRYAYEFDGSSSIIQIANESLFDAADSVVVELDIWFDDVTSSGYKGIVAKRDGGTNITNYAINYQGSTNQFQWYFNDGSGFQVHVIDLRTYFSVDQWYHVKLSFQESGSNVESEIIIDGGTPLTTTFTGKTLGANNVPVTIGNSFLGSTQWHSGKVDNVKITIDGHTTAYYLFEDADGAIVTDRLGNANGTITGGGSWYSKATPFVIPPDVAVWLIADDVDGDGNPGNNSGDYSTWVDLSGNGNDFTAASGREPTYVVGALNGQAGLDFDGSLDVMSSGAIPALDSVQEYSIFIVFDGDVTTGTDFLFTLDTDLSGTTAYSTIANTTNRFSYTVLDNAGFPDGESITTTASDPYVAAFIWNNEDELYFFLGDTKSGVTTGRNASPSRHDNYILGGSAPSFGSFNGKMFELLVYARTLSDMNVKQVMEYLRMKYGL